MDFSPSQRGVPETLVSPSSLLQIWKEYPKNPSHAKLQEPLTQDTAVQCQSV